MLDFFTRMKINRNKTKLINRLNYFGLGGNEQGAWLIWDGRNPYVSKNLSKLLLEASSKIKS